MACDCGESARYDIAAAFNSGCGAVVRPNDELHQAQHDFREAPGDEPLLACRDVSFEDTPIMAYP